MSKKDEERKPLTKKERKERRKARRAEQKAALKAKRKSKWDCERWLVTFRRLHAKKAA